MPVVFHEYDVPGFRAYLEGYLRRGALLRATFLHHTWSPTAAQWRGLQSMEGIRRAHQARGFSDIACHAYATPQGTVFNARPPSVANCACQYPDEDASRWPPELRRISGGSKSWMNAYGFGIETVGNFDAPSPNAPPSEDPATSIAMRTSLDVLAIVHELWNIPVEHCFFHRDVSSKTCPGTRVTKAWVHAELRRRLMPETAITVKLGDRTIPCRPKLEDGTTRCDLRPLAEALGFVVGTADWPTITLTRRP